MFGSTFPSLVRSHFCNPRFKIKERGLISLKTIKEIRVNKLPYTKTHGNFYILYLGGQSITKGLIHVFVQIQLVSILIFKTLNVEKIFR